MAGMRKEFLESERLNANKNVSKTYDFWPLNVDSLFFHIYTYKEKYLVSPKKVTSLTIILVRRLTSLWVTQYRYVIN